MPDQIKKPLTDVAMLLLTRAAKTPRGKTVHAHVLARVEIALWIQEELSK